MSRSPSYLRRGLLGIVFMGAVGFGVTQALASPVPASSRYMCTPEQEVYCHEYCDSRGATGYCYQGRCQCILN